jgi:hypothetical protein
VAETQTVPQDRNQVLPSLELRPPLEGIVGNADLREDSLSFEKRSRQADLTIRAHRLHCTNCGH